MSEVPSLIAILESKIEQLTVEYNNLKCCGNCFYGSPCDAGIRCMDKASAGQIFIQSHKCGNWDIVPGVGL